jgi:protein-disulfide isomerase
MKPFYYILGLVAIVGAGLIGFSVMSKSKAATEPPKTLAPLANSQELVEKAKGVLRGQNTAPVKIMIFSDYMCPWCAVYAQTIENQVVANYVNTGKAVEIYHDFPLGGAHKYSFLAARAARCAEDQGKFWEYHDVLFANQAKWGIEEDPPVRTLKGYASDLSLDRAKFDTCIDGDMHADVVEYNHQLGQAAGVSSTPTIFINGLQAKNPLEWDKLRAEIDAAVGTGAQQ